MNRFKRTLMIVTSSLLLTILAVPCSAADSTSRDLDLLVATPTGGALLVLTSQPSFKPDYLSATAAADLLTSGGSSSPATSLIAIEKGALKISLPTITPQFQGINAKGLAGVMVKAALFSGTF